MHTCYFVNRVSLTFHQSLFEETLPTGVENKPLLELSGESYSKSLSTKHGVGILNGQVLFCFINEIKASLWSV